MICKLFWKCFYLWSRIKKCFDCYLLDGREEEEEQDEWPERTQSWLDYLRVTNLTSVIRGRGRISQFPKGRDDQRHLPKCSDELPGIPWVPWIGLRALVRVVSQWSKRRKYLFTAKKKEKKGKLVRVQGKREGYDSLSKSSWDNKLSFSSNLHTSNSHIPSFNNFSSTKSEDQLKKNRIRISKLNQWPITSLPIFQFQSSLRVVEKISKKSWELTGAPLVFESKTLPFSSLPMYRIPTFFPDLAAGPSPTLESVITKPPARVWEVGAA